MAVLNHDVNACTHGSRDMANRIFQHGFIAHKLHVLVKQAVTKIKS